MNLKLNLKLIHLKLKNLILLAPLILIKMDLKRIEDFNGRDMPLGFGSKEHATGRINLRGEIFIFKIWDEEIGIPSFPLSCSGTEL